jgi:hypothetical protein
LWGCAVTCWYFGVLEPPTAGHYVYREGSRSWDAAAPMGLRGETLDMRHTPPEPQTQGLARLSVLRRGGETVTILAWWDRTGDRRGNSNSALIVDRECTLAEMLAEGARAFPAVMARQTVAPYVEGMSDGVRGPILMVASDFAPDMVPQVSEKDRARFLAFLEANAAEVATWPEWKQRAFRLVKESGNG